MDKRRRMMLSGKAEPIVIFAYGDTSLQNGTLYAKNGNIFEDGTIKVKRWGSAPYYDNGSLDISVDFTKYKTLYIELLTNTQNYSTNKERYYTGYGNTAGYKAENYTERDYIPAGYKTLAFDISSVRGACYIKATAENATSETVFISIKNIWLE